MTSLPRVHASPPDPNPGSIRLRGARQNNLRGFDLDIPLGRYVVVTGLSGAGKSSLVFDTLHAEGQRRYVETFSAYTRQFLDLLDPPRIDSIENVRPSIAIAQTNTVKTSRSTVGTMTEVTDFAKVWFSHVAACFDPETGERVEDDNPQTIWAKAAAAQAGRTLLVAFEVVRPENMAWSEIVASLGSQGYSRVLLPGGAGLPEPARLEDLGTGPQGTAHGPRLAEGASRLFVVQDRVTVRDEERTRFLEAVETALHFGHGEVRLFSDADRAEAGHFSRGLHSPKTGRTFRPATPALFSFNSPIGACPHCRGFGRVIEIDTRLAIPDQSLSIEQGAIKCWEGEVYSECRRDLAVFARKRGIPLDVPFASLQPEQRAYVIDGEPGYGEENGKTWPRCWYGVKGFFRWLERNVYKMHVRVFLSRFRTYNTCPVCGGARLKPEALCWKWTGRTLPELYQLPVTELLALLEGTRERGSTGAPPAAQQADLAFEAMVTRLRYLREVGLGYLTLDRQSRTLSGGEVERVNLTSCLGTSLVDTLFVLDEPSVGLHPRDVDRLIAIIRSLTAAGNTVVVVEHDEAMIRAADHAIEIGPEPGARGGRIVYQGPVGGLPRCSASITGAYLSGRERIEPPARRRPVGPDSCRWIEFEGMTKHNLKALSASLPLRRLTCLSGVSGSGKSTLLDHGFRQGLLARRGQFAEDPAEIRAVRGDGEVGEVVLVDQGPLSRTARSNPALYTGAWEAIRELFASTAAAQAAGFTASSFSFNSGDGRCGHCQGLGHERVEMQFLADVFVPCPVCEGRRFKPEVLAVAWRGKSVGDVLGMGVSEARRFFAEGPEPRRAIDGPLAALEEVGLGYLALGQPLSTLSGGEAQRLKLVRYLEPMASGREHGHPGALILLDEPTTGLHRHDVRRLIAVLQALVDRGHTVVVIEHNLDVLKSADWILELGPEAGAEGGRIVAAGAPEAIAAADVATSPYLRAALGTEAPRGVGAPPAPAIPQGRNAHAPDVLTILGARENNLKNLSLTIPHHQLSVVTGISGSGKSTLAFDIVFAEGQRRFLESMSPYARQFVEQLPRPAVDRIEGIPPTVAIEQRVTRGTRKSTVATVTEVAQYLRLLYARLGIQHHPDTGRPVEALSRVQLRGLLARSMRTPKARRAAHLFLCAPLVRGRKGHHQPIADWIRSQGYGLMRADGRVIQVGKFKKLDRYREHDIEVVVADLRAPATSRVGTAPRAVPTSERLARDLDTALKLGRGSCFLLLPSGEVPAWFSTTRTDPETGESFPELDPKHFSFNSPRGWCPTCRGFGRIFPWMLERRDDDEEDPAARLREFGVERGDISEAGDLCPDCQGDRLCRVSRAVKLPFRRGRSPLSLPELLRSTADQLLVLMGTLRLDERGRTILRDIRPQIEQRLKFLGEVGLGYLSLDRPTEGLSGGEAQRIRLAAQLGSSLSGVLYVLDEPSIGLHARDNERLIETLGSLKRKGNTLLVVEHDEELMARADRIIDLGPGAGIEGGQLLASGTPEQIRRSSRSVTGIFLARGIAHPLRGAYRQLPAGRDWIELRGARFRNLKDVEVRIPLGRLVLVAGPSGAGKSTLFRDLLGPAVALAIRRSKARLTGREFAAQGARRAEFDQGSAGVPPVKSDRRGRDARASSAPPPFAELRGAPAFRSVIEVDQSPIGKTPRSTPATYLGIFDTLRQWFAALPESRIRGYTASRFSFNTAGGRCPTCEGAGRIRYEMAFLPDSYLPCDDCRGLRYGPELSDIRWRDRSIGEVLQLTFSEAAEAFGFHDQLGPVCRLMADCGLGYLTLGQSSPTLSGGEAQRLKLVAELSRGLARRSERARGIRPRNLYILEEPTIGLHLSDCQKLIGVLQSLVDQGHTVVVIEHHLDLLAEADYLVELGPGGGPQGGKILYQGPLKGILRTKGSPTAPYLRRKLNGPRKSCP